MILKKLYSNLPKFKTVVFNPGFNIILGTGDKLIEGNKNNSHNLGKTTIIKIVDYMLLKEDKNKESFLSKIKEYQQQDVFFFLEIETLDKEYYTIKRNLKTKKVSLKKHLESDKNLTDSLDWDLEDESYKKVKVELNKILNFDFSYDYRKYLKFIIRTQDDYSYKFKKDEVLDKDWKPQMLELFGYSSKVLDEILKIEQEIKELTAKNSDHSDSYFRELEEKKQLKELKSEELNKLKENVEKYNYYELDDSITDELVKSINTQIKKLNSEKYNLSFDIENFEQSLKARINTLDLEDINIIFEEVKVYFSDILKKDYEELIKFNKQISIERNESLKEKLVLKKNRLEKVNEELILLNKQQNSNLKILETNKIIEKVLLHNKELQKLEIEYAELSKELEVMSKSIENNKEVIKLTAKIEEEKAKIAESLEEKTEINSRIKNHLKDFTQKIFYEAFGMLLIYPNSKGKPEFDITLNSSKGNQLTSEADGNNYKKTFKGLFDLSILISYLELKKRYFKFLFHDGIIEASDIKIKREMISLIKEIVKNYNIQYITTLISDELNGIEDLIEEKDYCLKLDDAKDFSGTLFGERF